MKTSQFMDKQIMDLTGSATSGELFDLMNPQEEESHGGNNGGGVLKKEEIFPSYDFQPIRGIGSPASAANNNSSSSRDRGTRNSWGSADSKIASMSHKHANILEPHEVPKISHEKNRDAYNVATVTEIDRTVKKYADNLLHTLEGVSSRLSQLESRTRHLESSVDDLQDTMGNSNGSTEGKLRHLENILREVQTGVQVLRDKHEIVEAQLQLAKLQQSSSRAPESSTVTAAQPNTQIQQQTSPPPPSYAPSPPAAAPPQQSPPFPAPNAPPPPPPAHQNSPPQFPAPLPQPQLTYLPSLSQEPSYFPPSGTQTMQPQPQPQPQPLSQPPPQPQPQHYQLPQYSQQMPPSQPLNPPPPMPHLPEESAPYMPPQSQTYPQNIRQPTPLSQQPPASGSPQYYGSSQLPFPSGCTPSSGFSHSDSYPYSGSPSHYSSSMKPSPFSNSPRTSGGGVSGNYSRLPTAKILPQAVPTGSSSVGGSGRVPIDDVVDKVATMGFSREQVRAAVRELTENGQSVDLNVVLDKLMNDGGGEMIQPQKVWFGR